MATRFNTGNPIDSADPRDGSDNMANLDQMVNSTDQAFTDRFGVSRKTLTGYDTEIQSRVDNAVASWVQPDNTGDWATGTAYTEGQLWKEAGEYYFVLADYTSGASAAADIAAGHVAEYTNTARQRVKTSIADLEASTPFYDGEAIYLSAGGRSGTFEWLVGDFSAEVAADTLQGVYIKATAIAATVGAWVRKLDGYVTPEMFGGGGASAQAAEDVAYVAGADVKYTSIVAVTESVNKKAGVNWIRGSGKLIRDVSFTGDNFPLVLAQDVDDWEIVGTGFENSVIDSFTTINSAYANANALIAVERCSNWSVSECRGIKFSNAVLYSACHQFSINDNYFNSGYLADADDFENGTFTKPTSSTGSGGINSSQQLGVTPPASTNFQICRNRIVTFGLDIAIDAGTNGFERTPSVISENVIFGCNAGIQIYQGALSDDGSHETYQRNVIVTNNVVQYCWEQGIYVRLSFGCLVSGNVVRKANMNGTILGTGVQYGGIVTRVSQASFIPTSPVSDDVGNLIVNNIVVDNGRDTIGCTAGIQIRTESTSCIDNVIAQSAERGFPSVGYGLYIADDVPNADLRGNRVVNFSVGIKYANYNWVDGISVIAANRIESCPIGINSADAYQRVDILDNTITDSTVRAIGVRKAPGSSIKRNNLKDGGIGILISSGCFWSDFGDRSTARVGASLHVEGNRIDNFTDAHSISETTTGDISFFGRCAVWKDDIVDGVEVSNRSSAGTPATSSTRKDWNLGDQFLSSAPVASGSIGSVCVQPGNYNTLSGITGSISSGSFDLTVNDSDGLAQGVYITISGVSGAKRIKSVSGLVVTLDTAADATVSGASVNYSAPIFKAWGSISA